MPYIVTAKHREAAGDECDEYYVTSTNSVIVYDAVAANRIFGHAIAATTRTYASANSICIAMNAAESA